MKELKKKSSEDLAKLLVEKMEVVRGARFDLAHSTKKNVKVTALARKEIARIKTEQNMRNREAANKVTA